MPELIDKAKVLKYLTPRIKTETTYGEGYNKALEDSAALVALMPTIEAEPVRHGQMIEGRYPNENKCSECGQEFRDDIGFIIQDDDGAFHNPARCPECGCYWDGGADNGCDEN